MSPVTVPLNATAPIILDGNGNGTAQIGPVSAREVWTPEVASVSTNQAPGSVVNEAQCQVFEGVDTSQPNYVDGTLSGSTGDSTDNVYGPVYVGQYVFAVWTGGDAYVQAQLKVTGTKVIG